MTMNIPYNGRFWTAFHFMSHHSEHWHQITLANFKSIQIKLSSDRCISGINAGRLQWAWRELPILILPHPLFLLFFSLPSLLCCWIFWPKKRGGMCAPPLCILIYSLINGRMAEHKFKRKGIWYIGRFWTVFHFISHHSETIALNRTS